MSNKNQPTAVVLSPEEKEQLVRSTRRTDLRNIIGALFVVYGVLVTVTGILDPVADKALTGGIPINLWTGLSMFVGGILFFLWARLSPVPAEDILANIESIGEKIAEGEASTLAEEH
ncbi:hypothetical protein ACN08Z_03400 [Rothia sp. P7181]|uniref:hypothetical protein n=1 Tax=unclassified Rothia (in: high G+C Gram-positive bacteria) TaxID=2689056 RepID=UPI003AC51310